MTLFHRHGSISREAGIAIATLIIMLSPMHGAWAQSNIDVRVTDRERIISAADKYLREEPVTITSFPSPRSAGGIHDYSSDGDYWWPDPNNPTGPYIQKDGMTNPDNFVEHRKVLIRLSLQVPTLIAAYLLTREENYATHALRHLRAWFIAESTKMNPNLKFAQAVKGKATGRGTGIIDTIHLVEVARAISTLEQSGLMTTSERDAIRNWFAEYLRWIMTHEYGIQERDAKNNHGTCWVMQAAAFAAVCADTAVMESCRVRFKTVLLPNQLAPDGSFPLELKRTKPYGYSLFNVECLSAICKILSTPSQNLWTFVLPDGRGMRLAMEFIYPFMKDKRQWKYQKDVMHFDDWPVRQSSLLFAGLAYGEKKYLDLWKTLDPDPKDPEVVRNFPVRQPLLWINTQ